MQSHGGTAAAVRSRLFSKAKVKSLCMTAVIVAAFIVCWTPYHVVFIVHTFVDMTDVDQRYVLWIFFFGMANSMVNPLIYGAFHGCRCFRSTNSSGVDVAVAKPQARYVVNVRNHAVLLKYRCRKIGSLPSDHYFRSVCLSVCLCRVFLSGLRSDLDQTRTHVTCPGLVVSPTI